MRKMSTKPLLPRRSRVLARLSLATIAASMLGACGGIEEMPEFPAGDAEAAPQDALTPVSSTPLQVGDEWVSETSLAAWEACEPAADAMFDPDELRDGSGLRIVSVAVLEPALTPDAFMVHEDDGRDATLVMTLANVREFTAGWYPSAIAHVDDGGAGLSDFGDGSSAEAVWQLYALGGCDSIEVRFGVHWQDDAVDVAKIRVQAANSLGDEIIDEHALVLARP